MEHLHLLGILVGSLSGHVVIVDLMTTISHISVIDWTGHEHVQVNFLIFVELLDFVIGGGSNKDFLGR